MVNKLRSDPGKIAQLNTDPNVSLAVPSAAVEGGQAWQVLAGVAGNLSAKLGKIADDAAVREGQLSGLSAGQQSGAAYLQAKAANGEASGQAMTGPWYEQAKAILRKEEGFKETPYWDVNAHRVGYGSDTTIGADGKPVKVQQGMTITRDQAEADLNYRLTQREGATVQRQLGPAWDALPDTAKAVMASVGYNYGSLPDNIVAAAKTGDLQQLSAAVGGLSANPGRRKREASLILSAAGEAPAPSKPAATATAEPQPQAQPLSTLPLALRRDGTLYGEAYDQAATSAYAWRMQEGLSNDLFNAHLEHRDNPEEFAAAVADIRAKYAADPNLSDPQMREMFDKGFTERSDAYMRDVATKRETRMRAEQEASFSDGLKSAKIDLERQAQVLGASPEGDPIITKRVSALSASIDAAEKSATITPDQAKQYKRDIAETAALGRIQGVFEALPTPEAQEQFALGVLDDWKSGKGPLAALPFELVKAKSETLRRDARAKIENKTALEKIEIGNVAALMNDDVASISSSGKGLDPTTSGLTPERVRALTGEAGLVAWQKQREEAGKIYDATNGMEKQTASDIAQRLVIMQPKPGSPGYADDLKIYQKAQDRAKEVLKERETDPLGQAARAGAIEISPIDATSADNLANSLAARKQAQAAVSTLYGQPAPYFRPGEKEMLSSTLATHPEALSAFAFSVRDTFGGDTPKVLSEISEDAPVIAHAAGLAAATGDNSVAADIANTMAMKREKVFNAKMPTAGELNTYAATEVRGAFMADPRTQNAVLQTAAILFEHDANVHGFNPADIKTSGSPAQAAFAKALDRAAGGRTVGGKAYGGITEVNGQTIVVPSDMPKDEPQQLLDRLNDKMLAQLPPIASGDFPIRASEIRNATLISDGDGFYRVALGDPLSDNPRYVANKSGGFWRLDIRQLKDIAAANPRGVGGFNPFGWQGQP